MRDSAQPPEGDNATSARQRLLVTVERLPRPDHSSFQKVHAPPAAEFEAHRMIDDPALRNEVLASGLGELVQRPGPGNWKKTKPPPFILKIYPNFDAPASGIKVTAPRAPRKRAAADDSVGSLSSAVLHDLRTKWEQYYADTRPDRRREHERRAEAADPSAIAARAKEMIAEGRRAGRRVASREAMLAAIDELTSDFESVLRRRYGDIVVDVFGIPED